MNCGEGRAFIKPTLSAQWHMHGKFMHPGTTTCQVQLTCTSMTTSETTKYMARKVVVGSCMPWTRQPSRLSVSPRNHCRGAETGQYNVFTCGVCMHMIMQGEQRNTDLREKPDAESFCALVFNVVDQLRQLSQDPHGDRGEAQAKADGLFRRIDTVVKVGLDPVNSPRAAMRVRHLIG